MGCPKDIHIWASRRHQILPRTTLAAAATEALRRRREETAGKGRIGHGTRGEGECMDRGQEEMTTRTLRTQARRTAGRDDCARMQLQEQETQQRGGVSLQISVRAAGSKRGYT